MAKEIECQMIVRSSHRIGYCIIYLPAPVTRATLPSREAEAIPRGPGIWLYLPSAGVRPGMMMVMKRLRSLGDETIAKLQ
jgi:hypothetical protein